VAVGFNGMILTSPDGTNWTSRTGTGNLQDVAFGNGQFVAVGQNGTILTSPDGENWAVRTSGTTQHLYGVAYGHNQFIVVGDNGTILKVNDTLADWQIKGGFTEKAILADKTAYKLFDGKWLNFNSNGSVTWS
jgi:photosystem II stability/assembly factor-like uncharacterized protein